MADVYHQVARLVDADSLPVAVSDDVVIQLLGAAFARAPLPADALRDARLLAFLMDVEFGSHSRAFGQDQNMLGPINRVHDRLVALSGISIGRVRIGVVRLNQAGVLELSSGSADVGYRFSDQVMQPVGIGQYVDWLAVLGKLAGRAPALIVLRAVLDLLHHPWEWERLTYEGIALHACYSLGMAQRGVLSLLDAGVLERAIRAGRGHDYRLTQWALGRGPAPQGSVFGSDADIVPARDTSTGIVLSPSSRESGSMQPVSIPLGELADSGPMVVEIGGLIVHVPIGTEIHMTLGPDGVPVYQLGADMRITRRGGITS